MSAIEAFWSYWRENEAAILAAIANGTLQDWAEPINERVTAMGDGLQWEFGPGREASHYFCVASPGNLAGRARAQRWLRAAPPAGPHFEFYASRPGRGYDPGMRIVFDEQEVTFGDFVFAIESDEHRRRVDIEVWHPAFEGEAELAPRATFVALDTVLGEDAVETWVGGVDVKEAPIEGQSFEALMTAVRAITQTEDSFTILRGEDGEGRVFFVTARLGLKAQQHVEHDRHIEVVITLQDPTEHGLTNNEEAERLNDAENALMEKLGDAAVYIGRETGHGERRLYFHADSEGEGLPIVLAWVEDQPWSTEVKHHEDPDWSILRRW